MGKQDTSRGLITLFMPTLQIGGAERVMVLLALGFKERDFDVDLVLVRAGGPFMDQVPDGVGIVDLGARRTSLSLLRFARYLKIKRPGVILSTLDHTNIIALGNG